MKGKMLALLGAMTIIASVSAQQVKIVNLANFKKYSVRCKFDNGTQQWAHVNRSWESGSSQTIYGGSAKCIRIELYPQFQTMPTQMLDSRQIDLATAGVRARLGKYDNIQDVVGY